MASTEGRYVLGTDDAERARLIEQCEVYRDAAERLVDDLGVCAGWRAIDIGCGPLGILDVLADRVGSAGEVTGLEREPRMLKMATRTLAERNLGTVHLTLGDAASTGLPDDSFDFVHERLVLFNIDNPVDILTEMSRIARPGGYLALQDYDYQSWLCHPHHHAWEKLRAALEAVWVGDPRRGRQLPRLLRDAGIGEIGVDVHTAATVTGDAHHMAMPYLAHLYRDRILACDAMTAHDLDQCVEEVRTHLTRSDTITQTPTVFQAWGQKPRRG